MNSLPCITLNRHAQDRAKKRHPWIFSNELSDPKRFMKLEPGSLVDVLDCHGDYLGTGFVNPSSLIAVRILSRNRGEAIDGAFFRARLEKALGARDVLYGAATDAAGTYRACFGEGDGLPGLIVDRYQGAWVIEPHALGMQIRSGIVAEALQALAKERYGENNPAIVVRTDHRSAKLEGIEPASTLLSGELKEAWAAEHGLRFPIDPLTGQKTGFFFDQRDNRAFFRRWAEGKAKTEKNLRVLDVFCHAGAWGLGALRAGAAHVTFVDSSASALDAVRAVAKKLDMEGKIECVKSDALEALQGMKERSFDMVALDPPALITNKKSFNQGAKAYRDLNAQAMRLVAGRGVLSTSSCSYHLQEERFEELVQKALLDSGREAQVLQRGAMSADHPVLPAMAEGRYLKNLFLTL
ncbi:MAG TPA: class I SAM-dependent rRNA methyltransferase [Bdellovibrionota bacterium]|jgi:23S rRNA (cytosine1962-C5)-methyltransferase